MGGGSSLTKGDWLNLNPFTAITGTPLSGDTRAARDFATAEEAAAREAAKPQTKEIAASSAVGPTGGTAGENIESIRRKKKRAGTSAAQIPTTTGIGSSGGVGLGGV